MLYRQQQIAIKLQVSTCKECSHDVVPFSDAAQVWNQKRACLAFAAEGVSTQPSCIIVQREGR